MVINHCAYADGALATGHLSTRCWSSHTAWSNVLVDKLSWPSARLRYRDKVNHLWKVLSSVLSPS